MEPTSGCCNTPEPGCVFAKAVLARAAPCAQAERRMFGEQAWVACRRPDAQAACERMLRQVHERARFALKLPAPGRPVLHMQALRLQCGGLQALRRHVGGEADGIDGLVARAEAREGGTPALPWNELVAHLAAWRPVRRRGVTPDGPDGGEPPA